MFTRTLVQIYGPFCIYTYGFMIALGMIITLYLIHKHPKRQSIINDEQLIQVFTIGTLLGIIGGRLLHILGSDYQFTSIMSFCALYEGGFSILGTIIAILAFIPWYLKKEQIPILPFLDIVAIYAPLLQSISRLGCYFAGCCYGTQTTVPWAVTYTDPDTLAPLFCSLHPTQLYSSISLCVIFLFMYVIAQFYFKKPGQLVCLYLGLTSFQRFMVDFLRDNREFFKAPWLSFFSIHQWLALALAIGALISFMYFSRKKI